MYNIGVLIIIVEQPQLNPVIYSVLLDFCIKEMSTSKKDFLYWPDYQDGFSIKVFIKNPALTQTEHLYGFSTII